MPEATRFAAEERAPDDGGMGVVADASSPPSINAPRIFLGDVSIEKHSGPRLDGKGSFKLVVRGVLGSSALGELKRRGVPYTQRADAGELIFRGYPQAHDRPTARDRASSFIIDYDSDDVTRVRESAQRDLGKHPTMSELAEFVNRYIVTKNLQRPYDPASVVARRREGDCSEHAVLLAALGRSFGFATRVVHGIVILDSGQHIEAEGHAWVEWSDVSGWLPADAAVPIKVGPVYIPLQLLKDESPAYGRQLLLNMSLEIGPIVVEAP
jgi:transglutaminase-like putative cysteine protease